MFSDTHRRRVSRSKSEKEEEEEVKENERLSDSSLPLRRNLQRSNQPMFSYVSVACADAKNRCRCVRIGVL